MLTLQFFYIALRTEKVIDLSVKISQRPVEPVIPSMIGVRENVASFETIV